jgi:hypothetical protein
VTDVITIRPWTVHIFHCTFTHISTAHNLYFVFYMFSWWWHSLVKTHRKII